jgi:mycofactocin precursor
MSALIVAGITRFRKEHAMQPNQDVAEQHEQVDEVTVEDLVEEVSIDGMCGVY